MGDGQSNGATDHESTFVGSGPDHAMTFEIRDVADISIPEVSIPEASRTPNGTSAASSFRTDADITSVQSRTERTLQPWIPDTTVGVDMSLDSSAGGNWDQFETNNRLFGANSTYDESLYTTQIDRSAPSYKRKEAEAAKIALEIEGSSSTNTHTREERGQLLENDGDEEDKYSSIKRDDFPPLSIGAPNRYTPPARRAPTSQPTVAGAPFDPAIISAQMSRPDASKATPPKTQVEVEDAVNLLAKVKGDETASSAHRAPQEVHITPEKGTSSSLDVENEQIPTIKARPINTSVSPQRTGPSDNPSEDVENKVLDHFRQFATQEKMKYEERRRKQACHDRTAKLNDLLRFSKTFKLRTPVPTDLVGILAKDLAKQEQIIEKAQKEHDKQTSTAASPVSLPGSVTDVKTPSRPTALTKFDPSTVPPPLGDRSGLGRGRHGYTPTGGRNERPLQPQAMYPGRNTTGLFGHRAGGMQQEKKPIGPPNIPTPIPIHENRAAPLASVIDQSGPSSPQRSGVHTPTSAVSTKFNVKALEFRPNATAPTFSPAGASHPGLSPRSADRTRSVSRVASPSSFFGAKRPKPTAERPIISKAFNPIKRMKQEVEEQKDNSKKDYSSNGGIPQAYETRPVWDVKQGNQEKTYLDFFEKPSAPAASPAPSSRSASSQQIPYQHQVPYHLQNGHHGRSHAPSGQPTSQHLQTSHLTNHYDETHHRLHIPNGMPYVYPSPRLPSGQLIYQSPMGHPAQAAYGQPVPQFFTSQGGQTQMAIRQYPGTPQYLHTQPGHIAAPLMVQQPPNNSFMGISPQYGQQMQMYSPSPAHAYPQHVTPQPHSGYPSPNRGAPMMLHQTSQQGHHPGQQVIYTMPSQPGHMGYPQQTSYMPQMTRGYTQHGGYGSSLHQLHHVPSQRAPSNGYGQIPYKVMPQHMQPTQGAPQNMPQQQHVGYAAVEMAVEENK